LGERPGARLRLALSPVTKPWLALTGGPAPRAGTMSKKEIEEAYAISRRIEGEERALEAAVSVTTSTQQEIDEQWNLYDGRAPPRLAPLLGWRQPRRGMFSQRQRDKDAESILGRQPCFFSIYTQDWLSQRQGNVCRGGAGLEVVRVAERRAPRVRTARPSPGARRAGMTRSWSRCCARGGAWAATCRS